MIYLEIRTFGVMAEVGVNGVAIVGDTTGEGLHTIRPVDDWLRSGTNTLTARIGWPEGPELERATNAEVSARVCLADPSSPARPRAASVLAEFKWPVPDMPELEYLPLLVSEPFEVQDAPELRLWSESQSLRGLSSLDKSDIVALVERLRLAIVEGRHDEAYALSTIKFEDDIRANGGDPDELRETVIEQFGWMTSPATVESSPVTVGDAEFILCGDDRVVHVARPQSPDAFDVIGDAMKASVRVYVARINGEWTIVR